MITYKKTKDTEKGLSELLNPLVKKWFYSRFKKFSIPQLYAVSEVHNRQNILVSAPTGATKTLTGFLAILNELVDLDQKKLLENKIYTVYISPLKALNNDISVNLLTPLKEMEKLADKKLNIRVAIRTGDTTQKEKAYMLKNPPHILITTPESLAILLASYKFKDHLKNVEWCIIDEIHALAENKRGTHLSLSLERLQKICPEMTRIGLSATVAPIEEMAQFLVGTDRDCKIVDVQFIKQLDLKVISPIKDLISTPFEETHNKLYDLLDKLIQEHKTTLIFTNTRSATERIVHHLKLKFPKNYIENIGAHHGSLSKQHRLDIENKLREGKLKVVVCSTSLELGIDIGYIDLVLLLGSPKSVARALQRCGRAGHQLHSISKGRIIVLDRDDLVECSVLLKSAIEKKIDRIHIPKNALDVLAQQINGITISEPTHIDDIYKMVKSSYCYKNLKRTDFNEVIDYLAGEYTTLEDRYIYAKIWHDKETGMIGKKGRLTRVIHLTNIGTIPDESYITVKIKDQIIGKLDESFLEKLNSGDIFVLGGSTYQFKFSRGMVAQVVSAEGRQPTVPSWFSEMLPLSFDLAQEIGKFRRIIDQMFCYHKSKQEIIKFINDYLYIDNNSANSIYEYFKQQFDYSKIPFDKRILIENYKDDRYYTIFHTLFGRRVNDCLSRAIAYVISRNEHKDIEVGINDNGFYLASDKPIQAIKAFNLINTKNFESIIKLAIEKSEVYKRRFRHCATRSLMILRNYKGQRKGVGRQQVSSMILMSALKRISNDFIILKEARREVLEDLMDLKNTEKIIKDIEDKKISIVTINTQIPTPFAFNLVAQGYSDIMRIDDKIEFLKRMHNQVLAKISLKK